MTVPPFRTKDPLALGPGADRPGVGGLVDAAAAIAGTFTRDFTVALGASADDRLVLDVVLRYGRREVETRFCVGSLLKSADPFSMLCQRISAVNRTARRRFAGAA